MSLWSSLLYCDYFVGFDLIRNLFCVDILFHLVLILYQTDLFEGWDEAISGD